MRWELVIAAFMALSLLVYCLTGGADFGGGIWNLFASGSRRFKQRKLIAQAIAPIWEANHVWLIVLIVLMFSAFPKAFAAISIALHIPLLIMLIGIVLRGSAFAFRSHEEYSNGWEMVFALSSILTPLMLGTIVGAMSSGLIRIDAETGEIFVGFVAPWLRPFPLMVGIFAVVMFAFLAAVYLTLETKDRDLQEDFRRRALVTGVGVGLLAWVCYVLSRSEAPNLHRGLSLTSWALPFQLMLGGVAVAALAALWRRHYLLARFFAAAQVSGIVLGWAFSQFPYLVAPDLTLTNSVTNTTVLKGIFFVLIAGLIVIFPAFIYLYKVSKGEKNESILNSAK